LDPPAGFMRIKKITPNGSLDPTFRPSSPELKLMATATKPVGLRWLVCLPEPARRALLV
jgi:hypothetical protein